MLLRLLRVILLSACIGIAPVQADSRQDHEIARRALEAGEILSLRQVLERIEREHHGQVLEVELEQEDQRWIYEVKMLRRDGGINKLIIDARDGRVLEIKGRHGRQLGRDN
ncbi:MAG: PepSY domain-containing protein [Parazoarcus communis]